MRALLPSAAVMASFLALAGCGLSDDYSGSSRPPAVPGAPAYDPAVYQRSLNAWLNKNEADLISAWGVPERSQRLTDGGQALEYQRTDPVGRVLCTTLFTSDIYGVIRTWTYRGSDCRTPHLSDYGTS
jgi:hypothetical protein